MEEHYISYIFLRKIGNQHSKLKTDLQNGFTTGDNFYPNTRQATLHFLDKYSKSVILSQPTFEGAAFSQKYGDKYQGGENKIYDKKYWKTEKCFKCDKEGHSVSHCP